MIYVRATGINRWLGGSTYRWLRIRSIKDDEIKVVINGRAMYTKIHDQPRYLEFAIGKWPNVKPCSWQTVLREAKSWN
jgi:hypothetical protein